MEGKRLIESMSIENLLSYGAPPVNIDLQPLNVLIGPNASGKSNLLDVISLLASTHRDLTIPIRQGGGIREWLWKVETNFPIATIQAAIKAAELDNLRIKYKLSFVQMGQRIEIYDESAEDYKNSDKKFFTGYAEGNPQIASHYFPDLIKGMRVHELKKSDLDPQQSILAQRKDPDHFPEMGYLDKAFNAIRIYRDWNLGRNTKPRLPQSADLPEDFLLEDASNLGLVLNDLQHKPGIKRQIIERLKQFYAAVVDITTKVQGGTVQIFLHEMNLNEQLIPATRMSDGMLHYLILLSILIHPSPPALICIEEPELGLHPDIIPIVAELLIEASQRTQLIVTTHSDALVSALTNIPESVLVCERDDTGTHLTRLESEPLQEWLEKYSLGELWRMGEIGGVR